MLPLTSVKPDNKESPESAEGPHIPRVPIWFLITGGSFAVTGGAALLREMKERWSSVVRDGRFYAYALDYDVREQERVTTAGFEFVRLFQDGSHLDDMKKFLKQHKLKGEISEAIEKLLKDPEGRPRVIRLILEANAGSIKEKLYQVVRAQFTGTPMTVYFAVCFSPCGPTGSTVALFCMKNLPLWFSEWGTRLAGVRFELATVQFIPDSWRYRNDQDRNGAVGYFSRQTLQEIVTSANYPYLQYPVVTFSALDYCHPGETRKETQTENDVADKACTVYPSGPVMDWLTKEFADTAAYLLSGTEPVQAGPSTAEANVLHVDETLQSLGLLKTCNCTFCMCGYPELEDYKTIEAAIKSESQWLDNHERLRQALLSQWMLPQPLKEADVLPLDEWLLWVKNPVYNPPAEPKVPRYIAVAGVVALLALLALALAMVPVGFLLFLPANVTNATAWNGRLILGAAIALASSAATLWKTLAKWEELKDTWNQKHADYSAYAMKGVELRSKIDKALEDGKTRLEDAIVRESFIPPIMRPKISKSYVPILAKEKMDDWFKEEVTRELANSIWQGFFRMLPNSLMRSPGVMWLVPKGNNVTWGNIFSQVSPEVRKALKLPDLALVPPEQSVVPWRVKWILYFGPEDNYNGWETYKKAAQEAKSRGPLEVAILSAYGEDLAELKEMLTS